MKNNPANLAVVCLCLFLSGGCTHSPATVSAAGGQPAWLRGDAPDYPAPAFLTATGSASKAETARDRALANLAKIFAVNIDAVQLSRESVSVASGGKPASLDKRQRLDSRVSTRTEQRMQGARIAALWQNPQDASYHALAVLDRHQARRHLRAEMNRIEATMRRLLPPRPPRRTVLSQIHDVQTAIGLFDEWQGLRKKWQVVDGGGHAVSLPWSMDDLLARRRELLKRFPLRLAVSDENALGLADTIQAVMHQSGLVGDERGHRLLAVLKTRPVFEENGWYWLRASLRLQLQNPDASRTLGVRIESMKVSARHENDLKARLQKRLRHFLEKNLFDSILSMSGESVAGNAGERR